MKNCEYTNERFSMLYCGNVLVHIVEHLGELMGHDDYYRILLTRTVKDGVPDARHSKKSDYNIIKIANRRTIVVVELKDFVAPNFLGNDKALAQLVLEVYYAKEKDHSNYTSIVGVLASVYSWHIMLLSVDCLHL